MSDFLIIGAGPAGMACAITAAQHGLQVLVLEKTYQTGGAHLFEKRVWT